MNRCRDPMTFIGRAGAGAARHIIGASVSEPLH